MNPNTGATYPDLQSALDAGEKREDIIELSGEQEILAETIEALQDRARSMGTYEEGKGLSAREIRRHLEREE